VFSLLLGFALVWHIWWLAIASLVGIVATVVLYGAQDNEGYYIPADTVRKIEEQRTGVRMRAPAPEAELEAK